MSAGADLINDIWGLRHDRYGQGGSKEQSAGMLDA